MIWKKIYGAIGGTEAILAENFLDMRTLPDEKIELLLQTPVRNWFFQIPA